MPSISGRKSQVAPRSVLYRAQHCRVQRTRATSGRTRPTIGGVIVRRDGAQQLLITQPDHASLAARVMDGWQADGWRESPRQAAIRLAIAEHDNGWREPDESLLVGRDGRILDFVAAPDEVRRAVWPRGTARLAASPYAAALVAQHALHVYDRYRTRADWRPFFSQMEQIRDRWLAASDRAAATHLLDDYFFVRMADTMSLTFCNGWTEIQEQPRPSNDRSGAGVYRVRLSGSRLIVSPDPFGGHDVPFAISARQLPSAPFRSADEARRAFDAAPVIELTGVAAGSARI